MNLGDLGQTPSRWLCGDGPHNDVVVSSRVRLARNLAGFPFLSRAGVTQRAELMGICRKHILGSSIAPEMLWVDLNESSRVDRMILVERHAISRQHSRGDDPRGVAISGDEAVAIMVNEEDHLRLQSLRAGLQLEEAYHRVNEVDDLLEAQMDFAFSPRLGYLAACPTNVGTGIRVSVMLHLPALKLTGEIDKLRQAAKDMHLAVRGFYGEGTESIGDLYQLSNQTTLGRTERQILEDFDQAILPRVIEYERRARVALAEERLTVIEDKVYRAWGTLCQARLLGSDETMYLLSAVRLGVCLGLLDRSDLRTINELMLLCQSAHLQKIAGKPLSRPQRRAFRAEFIRRRFGVQSDMGA